MRIKKGDTVKTATAGDQLPLLSDHIIADQKDLSSFQPLSGVTSFFSSFIWVFRIPTLLQPSGKW